MFQGTRLRRAWCLIMCGDPLVVDGGTNAVTIITPGGFAIPDTVRRWRIVCPSHPPGPLTRADRQCTRHFCADISGAHLPEPPPPHTGGHAPQEGGGED